MRSRLVSNLCLQASHRKNQTQCGPWFFQTALHLSSCMFHVSFFIIWYTLLTENLLFVVCAQKIRLRPSSGCGGGILAILLTISFDNLSLKPYKFHASSAITISLREQSISGLPWGDIYDLSGPIFGIHGSIQQLIVVLVLTNQHKFSFSKGQTFAIPFQIVDLFPCMILLGIISLIPYFVCKTLTHRPYFGKTRLKTQWKKFKEKLEF